jgi:hypothetical protein
MIRLSVTDLTKGIKKIIPKEEMWERGSNSTNTDLIKECKCKTKSIRSDSVMLVSRNATLVFGIYYLITPQNNQVQKLAYT